jgi:hypothetical protein
VAGGAFFETSTSTVRQGGLSTSTRGGHWGIMFLRFFVLVLVLVLEFCPLAAFRSSGFPARDLSFCD